MEMYRYQMSMPKYNGQNTTWNTVESDLQVYKYLI